MKSAKNPFIISGYEGSEYFCDRVQETAQLSKEIANGNNVTMIAPRRMGKSGLIEHYFSQPDYMERYYTFFNDIYDTISMGELIQKLSREILMRLKPYGRRVLQQFWDTMRSLQPGISFSPTGEPSFNVQIGDIQSADTTLDEIFRYLESADKPCIVAVDEFQQISKYSEKNIEAKLRTYVQHCHNAQFIFSGSQRHIMSEMFTSASRPFYQSVSMMHLESINPAVYDAFARELFSKGERTLAEGVTEQVYQISQGVTWFTQKMFNTLYANTPVCETCTVDQVPAALDYIIKTQAYSYEETLFRLPEKQKTVLIALAKNGATKGITSGAFIRQYRLTSASAVQAAVKGLLEKDFITCEKGVYSVYDLFMAEWLRRER